MPRFSTSQASSNHSTEFNQFAAWIRNSATMEELTDIMEIVSNKRNLLSMVSAMRLSVGDRVQINSGDLEGHFATIDAVKNKNVVIRLDVPYYKRTGNGGVMWRIPASYCDPIRDEVIRIKEVTSR